MLRRSFHLGVGALRVALTLVGVLIVLIALLTLGARAGLPFVSGYKADIEAGLADYLGQPVSVDGLDVRWRGSGPQLKATGLVVGADDGAGRLAIAEAQIDIDVFASAWRRRLMLNELTLVGADFVLERGVDGRVGLRGLGPGSGANKEVSAGGVGLLDSIGWLFDARRVGLVDTRLELQDLLQGEDFTFAELNLSVENDGDAHRVRVGVDLPTRLGGHLDIGIDLDDAGRDALVRARARDLAGQFQLRSDRLDLRSLARLAARAGVGDIAALVGAPGGMLALDAVGRLDGGRIESLSGRVELGELIAAGQDLRAYHTFGGAGSDRALPPDTIAATIDIRRDAERWSVIADDTVVLRGEQRLRIHTLRAGQADEGWRIDVGGSTAAPLELAASLATLVPPARLSAPGGRKALAWLGDAAPGGSLQRWQLSFASSTGTLDAALDIDELAFDPVGPVPGVAGMDLSLRFAEGTGSLELSPGEGGSVTLSPAAAFSESLRLSALDIALQIDAGQSDGLRVSGPVAFTSDTLDADSRVAVTLDGAGSPLLDLRGRFTLGDVADVAGFLPDRLLGRNTVDWFERSLVSGAARDGDLLWFGRLADFPYEDGEGVFRVAMAADDVTLDWAEGWPAARALRGQVTFDGVAFEARTTSGRIDALAIDRSRIAIGDLREGQLSVVASGTGALPAMLEFATDGPLADMLRPALEDASGTGSAGLDLDVRVPLTRRAAARNGPLSVDGSLFLNGNALAFARADIALDAVTGGIAFDEQGARMHGVKARWLGRPIRLSADTSGQGRARQLALTLSGALDAPDVIAHYGLPLDRYVRGSAHWDALLTVPFDRRRLEREGVTLSATSNLVGIGLVLPEPLGKPSGRAGRFTLTSAFRVGEPTVRWSIEHDRQDGSRAVGALADVADGRLLSLALGLGRQQPNAAGRPGLRIDGDVGRLAADGWIETIAQLIEDIAAGEDSTDDDESILPISGELTIAALSLRDAPLGAARLQLNSDADYLNTVVVNKHLNGNLRYPRQRRERDGTLRPLRARLALVDTAFIDALRGESERQDESSDVERSGPDPRLLPPLEARIARLRYKALDLDGLTLRTTPATAGLDIAAIGFTHRDLQLIGTGRWHLIDPLGFDATRDGEHVTDLTLTLQSGDFGTGLAAIGLGRLLGATAGRASATLNWPGPAWKPAVETLGGDLQFALERGRIVPLEPGAGKLLGLFAFQSLPRRLNLDFSDVLQDGLAFNTLDGRGTLKDGVLQTPLMQLTGPVGVIDMSGTTDLVAQTQDMRVTVLPRVSAALPIIGAISGGASAGLTVLIAGGLLKVLGVDFDRIGLREYRLTGPWAKPVLEPVT